jgi:predicted peroxiredoxin
LAKLLVKRYDEVWILLGNNAIYIGKKGLTKPEAAALDEAAQAGCQVLMWEEDMGFRGVTKDMVKDYIQIMKTDAYMDALVMCDKTIAF